MILEWSNARSPVNLKPGVASSIRNANRSLLSDYRRLELISTQIRLGRYRRALSLLATIRVRTLPALSRIEYFELATAVYQNLGMFHSAIRAARELVSVQRSSRDRYGLAIALLQLGDILRQCEMFSESSKKYSEGGRVAKSLLGNDAAKRLPADSMIGIALCHRAMGRYRQCLHLLNQALTAAHKRRDRDASSYLCWAIGTTHRFAGNLRPAEKYLRQSLMEYQRLGDVSGVAYARAGLGGTLRMRGLAHESGILYRQAHKTFRHLNDLFGVAYTWCGQSNAARLRHQFPKALGLMNRAANLYMTLGQKGPLGFVLWSRAQLLAETGKADAALRDLKRAKRLFSNVKDHRGLVYVALGFGEVYRRLKPTLARSYFATAHRRARQLSLPLERAHAERRLYDRFPEALYAKTGVDLSRFQRYTALP